MLRKPIEFHRLHWQDIKQEILDIKFTSCVKNTKSIFFLNDTKVSEEEFRKTPIKSGIVHCEYEIESNGIYREDKIIGSFIAITQYIHYGYNFIDKCRWEVIKDNNNEDIKIVRFRDTVDFCNERYNLIKDLERKQLGVV